MRDINDAWYIKEWRYQELLKKEQELGQARRCIKRLRAENAALKQGKRLILAAIKKTVDSVMQGENLAKKAVAKLIWVRVNSAQ